MWRVALKSLSCRLANAVAITMVTCSILLKSSGCWENILKVERVEFDDIRGMDVAEASVSQEQWDMLFPECFTQDEIAVSAMNTKFHFGLKNDVG